MLYSDAEIRQYIRQVVREAKDTARVDTGYLKRSIKGDLIGRNKSVEFREIFYGAYGTNSKLVEIAKRIMPKDIQWKVVLVDEDGNEQAVKGTTRTGRTISASKITSGNISTNRIKDLIRLIKSKASGKEADDRRKASTEDNN